MIVHTFKSTCFLFVNIYDDLISTFNVIVGKNRSKQSQLRVLVAIYHKPSGLSYGVPLIDLYMNFPLILFEKILRGRD